MAQRGTGETPVKMRLILVTAIVATCSGGLLSLPGQVVAQESCGTLKECAERMLALANILKEEKEALRARVQDLEGKPKWPTGSYCILRGSSACPAGFSQVDANISAISTFSATNHYIGAAQFGASAIGVHNRANSPNWFADLKLSVCCT